MKKILVVVTLVVVLLSQGCCSIFSSGPQTISVNSNPKGAHVTMGQYEGVTPYEVALPRGKDYVIQATLGDQTKTQALQKNIQPLYWVNILFWPGLIIDLATGTMYNYEPTQYNFDFSENR